MLRSRIIQTFTLLLCWINFIEGFFTPRIWTRFGSRCYDEPRKQFFIQSQNGDGDLDSGISSGSNSLSRRSILTRVVGGACGIALLLETYARSGKIQSQIDDGFGLSSDDNEITVIFHGAGGEDANTDELLKTLRNSCRDDENKIVKMINWQADSGDTLQASVRGSKIGKQLATSLLDQYRAKKGDGIANLKVHAIGISVGAFAADSFIKTLHDDTVSRFNEREKIYLQLTLLDPFQQKAVLGIGYGNRNFGKGVDYAQHYLNTDDPVPSTNGSLDHCATIDVTALRPEEVFGHDWPLVYYTRKLKETKADGFVPSDERNTIGSVDLLQPSK